MSDDDSAAEFGFDDPAFGFATDGIAGVNGSPNPTSSQSATAAQQLYTTATAWDFQTSPPFDAFGSLETTTAATQPGAVAPSWPASFFDQSQDPEFMFDGFSASQMNPNINFEGSQQLSDKFKSSSGLSNGNGLLQLGVPMSPTMEQKLRSIAMPPHLQYHSPNSSSSPGSSPNGNKLTAGSSPEQASGLQIDTRKRKVTSEPEDDDDIDDDGKPVKKTAHNMIEKRYRTNINDKIAALRDSVPSLRIMCKSARGEDTTEDREELHGLTPAHKLNKATVLSKATEYIRHLEKRNTRLLDENGTMQGRIAAFEKLFMAGAMNGSMSPMRHPPTPMQLPLESPQQFSASPASAPTGMIQVPEDMKRIISAQMAVGQPYPVPQQPYRGNNAAIVRQQQVQQQQQAQQSGWMQGNPYFGKLMVGSLAGLMIMEAVRENEVSNDKPEGRGLYAVPIQLVGSLASSLDFHYMGYHVLSSIKVLLLLGTFLWIFVPSLFEVPGPKPSKTLLQATFLRKAPHLASSIYVRRRAWLTSIQTVWVPRHNFLLEAAALVLKTAKLSLRNVTGAHAYRLLTGTTDDQEVARVKAWTIALDSQLAGGDVDVCKSRLVLTLLASGTLPDTPMRLMLKALHIRIVLWQCSRSSVLQYGANAIAAKLARARWKEARQLNQLLMQIRRDSSGVSHDNELPDHLAALVEQECDDILSPAVIQRAYNLTFNLETTRNVQNPIDGMDSVVDDVAVATPIDAVAAWWSTGKLHRVLNEALGNDADKLKGDIPAGIDSAIKAAPVGSSAELRAILARAVLVDKPRGANIAAALQAVKSDKTSSSLSKPDQIADTSSAPTADSTIALRCAMLIAHMTRVQETPHASLQGLDAVDAMLRPENTTFMTLLGFTSLMELMQHLLEHKHGDERVELALEKLAATLRLWMGGDFASGCGVEDQLRQDLVERCLSVTKSLVGMDIDTGYGTMSEDDAVQG